MKNRVKMASISIMMAVMVGCGSSDKSTNEAVENTSNSGAEISSNINIEKKPIQDLGEPIFSTTEPVEINAANGTTIYYTIDGSIPTRNSTSYISPIDISKTTTFKAIAIDNNERILGRIITKTYFKNYTTTLPVISLSTDSKNLFDTNIGIYTNFNEEWKIPLYIEYFNNNLNKQFSAGLTMKIAGEASRADYKKSFSCEFDKTQGYKSLKKETYQLYPNKDLNKIKGFKIRAGNHGYEIGDLLAGVIVEDGKLNVDYQAYRTVQMFMNGEYWGVYNIRERKGDDYIVSNYPDVDKKKLDLINNHSAVIKAGTYDDYKALDTLAKTYDNYKEVSKIVDEDSLIDYMIVMIYSGNQDWLWSNSRAWKRKEVGAKWRWILDDLDEGFNATALNANNFDEINSRKSTLVKAFFTLLANDASNKKFNDRFNSLLDTVLSPAQMEAKVNRIIDERKEYITQPSRWQISQNSFDSYVTDLKEFASKRAGIVRSQLNAFNPKF